MSNKMKSHKGIRKRVRVTAKGKVKHTKNAGAGHLMSSKSAKQRRRINTPGIVEGLIGKKMRMYHG